MELSKNEEMDDNLSEKNKTISFMPMIECSIYAFMNHEIMMFRCWNKRKIKKYGRFLYYRNYDTENSLMVTDFKVTSVVT